LILCFYVVVSRLMVLIAKTTIIALLVGRRHVIRAFTFTSPK
jgi:hypothetical protein